MTSRQIWVKPAVPVLVVGVCGGSGCTTTALGLANTAAVKGISVAAVEATPAGGDLAERGADSVLSENGIEQLLRSARGGIISDEAFAQASSHTGTSARILHRSGNKLATEADYVAVDDYLRSRRASAVYDVGHRLQPPYLAPLLKHSQAPIVLTVPCRVDAFNRMRSSLDTIGGLLGDAGLKRTVVTISNQDANGWPVDIALLRKYLGDKIWSIEQIPYDQHLGSGVVISYDQLAPETVTAYEKLAAAAVAASEG
ncbi:hypothetical protein G4H71_09645 [Rhodococcus triatomae]|uniref:MinD-like ATPase involved in chromosome partitioning or flagellar assembly n=1 Tax=Rhodococcus triatomae TaxID=300028 RepID=A0A1G8HMB3_9NOCA|nr:hypothetical protein [Rhodococcus triatomae]QNG20825.1 hypothetical protein G4H72_20740 [Rhodococcus triatomae]QNG23260.1 hypothetical protein G4H71_09645 [Rhodococcus triatomae]SDI07836.1 hypothetical protein SAMN05444695_1057 [Rhodococcus triatomae]